MSTDKLSHLTEQERRDWELAQTYKHGQSCTWWRQRCSEYIEQLSSAFNRGFAIDTKRNHLRHYSSISSLLTRPRGGSQSGCGEVIADFDSYGTFCNSGSGHNKL